MSGAKSVHNFTGFELEGAHCIEASAGTGKTYAISHLYVRLIIEKGLSIDSILVVTFTNAATEELRVRIRSLIKTAYDMIDEIGNEASTLKYSQEGTQKYNDLYTYLHALCSHDDEHRVLIHKKSLKDTLHLALSDIDTAPIYTIHSFCSRMLTEFAFESGSLFGSKLVADESPYVRRVVEDFYYDVIAPIGGEFISLFIQEKEDFVNWFVKLLKKLPDDPDIRVIPEIKFNAVKCKAHAVSLGICVSKIKTMFDKEFNSIADNYYKAVAQKVLNGRSFNEKRFDELKKSVADLSIHTALLDDAQKGIKKFSISNMLSRMTGEYVKGKKQFHFHQFFSLLEECTAILFELKIQIIAAYQKFIYYSEARYGEYRDKWNILSFKDILKDMNRALDGNADSTLAKHVRTRFKAALIDEFQDTDPLQYSIFTTIFTKEGYTLYIIGDPKQAVYQFRGADVFAYIKARNNAKNLYSLEKSFRSTPALTQAVNFIFGTMHNAFVFKEICYNPVDTQLGKSSFDDEGAFHIWFVTPEQGKKNVSISVARKIIAKHVAYEIQNLVNGANVIEGKPIRYHDIAVLVRKHYEAVLVQNALRQFGINSVIRSNESVFSSSDVWELLQILEAIIKPTSPQNVKRALITSIFGYNALDLVKLEYDSGFDLVKMRFSEYYDIWKLKGFIVMINRLLLDNTVVKHDAGDSGGTGTVKERMLRFYDGERVITNILHCAEILADRERQKKLGPSALVEWLKKSIYGKSEADELELRLESDANAVKIVTIHASKGLEYPVVFCPYLFNVSELDDVFVFHDYENNYQTQLCFKFKKNGILEKDVLFSNENYDSLEQSAKIEQLAESIRLAYVAMTRAKYRCYVGWGNINGTKTSALSYLFHHRTPEDTPIARFFGNEIESDDTLIFKELQKMENDSGGIIKCKQVNGSIISTQNNRVQQLYSAPSTIRTLGHPISTGWQLTSYTSLSYQRDDVKYDEMYVPVIHKDKKEEMSIFTFPAGSVAGSCIHNIFETLDFSADHNSVISVVADSLNIYGFDSKWTDIIVNMVRNVLSVPLKEGFVPLSEIRSKQRRHELEFYYPIEGLSSSQLIHCFKEHSLFTIQYGDAMQNISFNAIRGFMHGFIDMVFEYNNACYIVDWKSNLLGNSIEHYRRSNLDNAIMDHLYFLQYAIYSLALHRHLQTALGKTYSYDKHFGGIYYLFVRGMDARKGSEYGVFYDKPDYSFIERLNQMMGAVGA